MSQPWDSLRKPPAVPKPHPIGPGEFKCPDGPSIQVGAFGAHRPGSVTFAFGAHAQSWDIDLTSQAPHTVTFGPKGLRQFAAFLTELAGQMEAQL